MKWVTLDHVHMDRVASPWLIKRFIDRQAEFAFLPYGQEHSVPKDVMAFGFPGAPIGPHDAGGSTFRKLMDRHVLPHPALLMMAEMIESGIAHVLHHSEVGYSVMSLPHVEGVGLDALAYGMMYATNSDAENVEKSMAIYDALFEYCRVRVIFNEMPELQRLPFPQICAALRAELATRE
jgi:hypothetical protein